MAEWKDYWIEVIVSSFTWAITLWPWQTVVLGVLVTLLTMVIHRNRGQHEEAKNIGISLGIGIAASVIAFVIFVVFIGPFLHSEGVKPKLTELEKLRTEKINMQKELIDKDGELTKVKDHDRISTLAVQALNEAYQKVNNQNKELRDFASQLKPSIRINVPIIRLPDMLTIYWQNIGPTDAIVSSAEVSLFIAGKLYRHEQKIERPLLVIQQGRETLEVQIPVTLAGELEQGKSDLKIVLEMKYATLLGKKYIMCSESQYYTDKKSFGIKGTYDHGCGKSLEKP